MGHFSPPPAERVDVPAGLNSQKICFHTNRIPYYGEFDFQNFLGKQVFWVELRVCHSFGHKKAFLRIFSHFLANYTIIDKLWPIFAMDRDIFRSNQGYHVIEHQKIYKTRGDYFFKKNFFSRFDLRHALRFPLLDELL